MSSLNAFAEQSFELKLQKYINKFSFALSSFVVRQSVTISAIVVERRKNKTEDFFDEFHRNERFFRELIEKLLGAYSVILKRRVVTVWSI